MFGGQGVYETTELFKCLSAIESLSKIGGWKGDIYFLIGNTKCLTDDAIESLETQNVHIIPIHEEHGYGILPNRNNNERKMEIKFVAWKYIAKSNPKIKTFVWYDCDVLFIYQGCVAKMLTKIPIITDDQPFFLHNGHVGTFLASPTISAKYFEEWRNTLYQETNKIGLTQKDSSWVTDYYIFNKLFFFKKKYGESNHVWWDSRSSLSSSFTNVSCALH